ncbi:hypothetical protein BDFG_09298 [Blastomyces dermatitidis ATCC 26199]|nr:hypothetical protein BDFG_09298 [Blastomyces dermatitidis ATCC 26199]
MRSAMGSECSYDRGLFDGSIGGFLFEKSSEFVVERLQLLLTYSLDKS